MGMIGFSNSVLNAKICLKSSVMDVENLDTSGVNAQRNRQADPMLMV